MSKVPYELPTGPQLVRISNRVEKAIDAIENASYVLLDARRVFDAEKVPTSEPIAMADHYIECAESALTAIRALLAVAASDLAKAGERNRAVGTTPSPAPATATKGTP